MADSSGSCCPPGSWDAPLNPSGPPSARGEMVTLRGSDSDEHQVDAYVTGESTSKKAIIVFSDVWGITDRAKAICDTLADAGYRVVLPDYFRGDDMNTVPDLVELLSKIPYSLVSKDIDACVSFLTKDSEAREGNDASPVTVGALGFCCGVWALAKASAMGVPLKCGVGPHPSTQIEQFVFKEDEKAMLEAVRMPILIMPAGNDDDKLKPGGEYALCLEKKGGKSIEFDEMTHGWTCRGDLTVKEVRRDAEKALSLALEFFQQNM